MLVRIDDIKEEGLPLAFKEDAEQFPELATLAADGEVRFLAPIRVRARAVRVRELVEVEGEVSTRVEFACSRCLKEFVETLNAPFALTFTREFPAPAAEPEEEGFEIGAEELGLVPFSGDEFDLRDQVQEQVVMALPIQVLCRPDCQGLCPQCGADRNAVDCGCPRPEINVKFAALKDFKVEK